MPKTESLQLKESEVLLFVGSYTRKEGHVDGKSDGVYGLKFDTNTGQLAATDFQFRTTNPSYLSVNAQTKRIYAVNEIAGEEPNGGGKVIALSYDEADQSIKKLSAFDAMGGAPCYIFEHDDHLFTANYMGGNHCVYALSKDGSIAKNTQIVTNEGKGVTPRQEAPHAHMIARNPHTGLFFGVDLGTDIITVFSFNKSKSMLIEESQIKLEAGSGPRHLDFHPTKDILYVINELNGTVDVIQNEDGNYKQIQNIHSTMNPNNQDANCADIHVHPNGKYLYASNRGAFNSIAIYQINEDGSIKLFSEKSTNGMIPRAFTIDPTGKFLLVANQNSDNIVVFDINETDGRLLEKNIEFPAPTPVCLKFAI